MPSCRRSAIFSLHRGEIPVAPTVIGSMISLSWEPFVDSLSEFGIIIDGALTILSSAKGNLTLPTYLNVRYSYPVGLMFDEVRLVESAVRVPDMGFLLGIPFFKFTVVFDLLNNFVMPADAGPMSCRAAL